MRILCLVVIAATAPLFAFSAAAAQKRIALVIGNSAYTNATELANPVNDASDMAAALKQSGFEVILGLDLDKRSFDGKVREFAKALEEADTGLLFYAGHGIQVGGHNYLLPTDAKLEGERDLDFDGVRLDFVLRQMELNRESKTNIVFLDACRDNPLARNLARSMGTRSASVGSGLAQVQAGVGTFVAYSTQPGNVALDGNGRNSPFTAALAKHIILPGRNLNTVMFNVRKDVLATTNGKQVPWDHSALTGDFYFQFANAPQALPKTAPDAGTEDANAQRIRKLEEELARKSESAGITTNAVLVDLRQRSRQLDQETKRDWQRVFEIQRKQALEKDTRARSELAGEIGRLQIQISRRAQDQRELQAEIDRVAAELPPATLNTK